MKKIIFLLLLTSLGLQTRAQDKNLLSDRYSKDSMKIVLIPLLEKWGDNIYRINFKVIAPKLKDKISLVVIAK